jgi:hypothetical protein
MILRHLLDLVVIPADGLKKPLECAWCDPLLQRDRFDILPLQFREQTADVRGKQPLAFDAVETFGEQGEKLGEHLSERCDILERHGSDLPWFRRETFSTRRVASFWLPRQAR